MHYSSSDEKNLKLLYSQWIILLMCFSCYFILQTQTINISIALIEMVNWTAIDGNRQSFCYRNNTDFSKELGQFEWGHVMQSQILASVMYTKALMYFPAEIISKRVNYKWLPCFGTAVASLCNFLTPVLSKTSGYALIVLQVLKAIAQAFIRPSFTLMIEQWVDNDSVNNYMSYVETGFPVSGFITILGAGLLCNEPEYGWETVFYVSGSMGILWCIVWSYLVSEYCYPTPLISGSEPPRIETLKKRVPLFHILKSSCVWAYIIVGMAFYWAYSFNILLVPLYFKRVFNANLEWNAIASAVPNLLLAFFFVLSTFVSERFVSINVVEKVTVRKFCVILGLSMFAGSSILLTFTECNKGTSSFVLTFGVGFTALTLSALMNLPLEMSPRFAGTLSDMMNTIGAVTGSFLPLMVGLLSESEEGINRWYKIFSASTIWSVSAFIVFLAFGSSKIQPWNDPENIHPLNTRFLQDDHDSSLPSSSKETVLPQSSRSSLKSLSIVDEDKLSDLLKSPAIRRNEENQLF